MLTRVSLLHALTRSQLDEARVKIARLETELAHLPAVYASRARLELERASSENDQLVVQARTLARRLSEAEEDKRRLSSSSSSLAAPEADGVSHPFTTTSVVYRRSPPTGPIGEQHDSANDTHGPEPKTRRAVRKFGAGERDADHDSADQHALDTDGLNQGQGLDRPGAVDEESRETAADQVDLLRRENQALQIDKSSLEERVSERFFTCYQALRRRRIRVDGAKLRVATLSTSMTSRGAVLTYTFARSPQLKVAEAQITRAEHHLRDLRAGMLQGAPLVVVDHELALPSPPVSTQTSPPQPAEARQLPPGKPRHVQLGDAEAELLLQAAKIHSHVNRINRVPLSRVIVEQAQEIIRAAPLISANDDVPAATTSAASAFVPAPSKARNLASVHPDPSTSSSATTSGSKTLDKEKTNGLLELARVSSQEDVVLPPLPVPQLAMPAPTTVLPPPPLGFVGSESGPKKRRRKSTEAASPDRRSKRLSKAREPSEPLARHVSEEGEDDDDTDPSALSGPDSDEDGSGAWPSRGVSHEDLDHLPSPPAIFTAASTSSGLAVAAGPSGSRPGKPLGQRLSALDVLAQASASQEAADYAHLPAYDADSTFVKGSKGKAKADPEAKARSRSASSVGPDGKKARSPYIKVSVHASSAFPTVSDPRVSLSLRNQWNVSEDEALIRAVIQCGCAWDSVAKLCPTRAYHQVRQRFLRGLKSGETLPPELMYLQPALLKSVQEYETKRWASLAVLGAAASLIVLTLGDFCRKRKKLAKQAAQRLAEDAMLEEQ